MLRMLNLAENFHYIRYAVFINGTMYLIAIGHRDIVSIFCRLS